MSFHRRKASLLKVMAAALSLTLLAFDAGAKMVAQPRLRSSSVLIVDTSDSSVIYSRHADAPMPIASITKLMTALVVLDAKQPLNEPLSITNAERDFPKGGFS